jgi:hypothetical protein
MLVSNDTNQSFSFSTGRVKDGMPVMVGLPAQATRDLDIPADHPTLVAGIATGALRAKGATVEKAVADSAARSSAEPGLREIKKPGGRAE